MRKKDKQKPSGSAVFMNWIMGITAAVSAVCFSLYYSDFFKSEVIIWTGITCFVILYHLGMRIIMGHFTKFINIDFNNFWFRERKFEKHLYSFLGVKKWKGKALTYNPELYDVKNRTLEQIAKTTAKSELDHWINVLISASTLFFSLVWGVFPIFLITAALSALFDMQFILIQRYNRPRLRKMLERENKKKKSAAL